MPQILLISSVFLMSSLSIFITFYNRKNTSRKDASALYNYIYLITVFIGWGLLFLREPNIEWKVLPYSIMFGIFFMICQIGLINALKTGSITITSLINQLSLIATTVWGFFFWGEKITLYVGIGLLLVVLALYLCICAGTEKNSEGNRCFWKWLIFSSMVFIGNAGCTIVQRTEQMHFNGQYGGMLMFFAIGIACIFYTAVFLKSDKTDSLTILRVSAGFPILGGVCNVLLNLFIMMLATSSLSPSLIYPVLSIGAIAATSVFSALVFKERLLFRQWIGIAVGACAVVLLSV